jgi:hypothetical protein
LRSSSLADDCEDAFSSDLEEYKRLAGGEDPWISDEDWLMKKLHKDAKKTEKKMFYKKAELMKNIRIRLHYTVGELRKFGIEPDYNLAEYPEDNIFNQLWRGEI